ncbi:DUF481 domain-containing protein [Bacteroidota bacterium]
MTCARSLFVLTAAICSGLTAASDALGQAEIRLQNGSILFGEVKKFEFAKLTVDTDDFGLIDIDWDPVVYVKAPGPFAITLANGRTVTGSIEADSAIVRIKGTTDMSVPRKELGHFEDFDTGFWNRASAGVDVGANVVRGNNQVTSLNVGVNLGYESDVSEVLFGATSIINEQKESEDTRRFTASASVDRKVVGRFRLGLSANFESDEAQQLDHRALTSIFISYRAISKQRVRLDITGGGGPTFEKYLGADGTALGEGKVGFTFVGKPDGDTSLDLSSYLYPGLFDFDRFRLESDLVFRIEIISDLTVNITAYYRYNSRPPVDVTEDDYGVTFGVGWTY